MKDKNQQKTCIVYTYILLHSLISERKTKYSKDNFHQKTSAIAATTSPLK